MPIDIEGDFQPVRHYGGKVTFNYEDKDGERQYQVGLSGSNPFPMRVFALYVLIEPRLVLDVVPLRGIGAPMPAPRLQPSLLVFVVSDREGFFGKLCPRCNGYFRTQAAIQETRCPYCGMHAPSHNFVSNSQRRYIDAYLDAFEKGYGSEAGESVTLDLDELAETAGANEAPTAFAEERQQTRFKCTDCGTWSDIAGRYGKCPNCGRRNSFALASRQLDALVDRVTNPRYPNDKREERDAEWRSIVKECVSIFEGFARDLRDRLVTIPATPVRRKAVEAISFHDPIRSAEELKAFFDIDLLRDLGNDERAFILTRFKRRHIYEHRAGVADDDYVRSDPTVRVGQLVKERSSNVATLIAHVRTMMKNFDEAFHSLR